MSLLDKILAAHEAVITVPPRLKEANRAVDAAQRAVTLCRAKYQVANTAYYRHVEQHKPSSPYRTTLSDMEIEFLMSLGPLAANCREAVARLENVIDEERQCQDVYDALKAELDNALNSTAPYMS